MRNRLPLISVIVPIYGVEPYLRQCIDSVLSQTYENLEVILVDDGSPDKCGAICDEYVERDSRVVAIHKENGGLSDARNCGIETASGKYIAFVDSDDYISPVFIEALYEALDACGTEVSAMPYGHEFRDGDAVYLQKDIRIASTAETLHTREYLERMLYQKVDTGVPWRLYSRRLLGNNPFPVGLYYEDLASVYSIVGATDKIAFIDCCDLYAYRLRSTGIIRQSFTPLKAESAVAISKRLFADISDWYPELSAAAASRCFSVCRMVYAQTPREEKGYRKKLWIVLKTHRETVLKDVSARKRERLAAFIACIGPHPFSAFCALCRKAGLMR